MDWSWFKSGIGDVHELITRFKKQRLAGNDSSNLLSHWQVSWPMTLNKQLPWTIDWASLQNVWTTLPFRWSGEKVWNNSIRHCRTHSSKVKHGSTHALRCCTWKFVNTEHIFFFLWLHLHPFLRNEKENNKKKSENHARKDFETLPKSKVVKSATAHRLPILFSSAIWRSLTFICWGHLFVSHPNMNFTHLPPWKIWLSSAGKEMHWIKNWLNKRKNPKYNCRTCPCTSLFQTVSNYVKFWKNNNNKNTNKKSIKLLIQKCSGLHATVYIPQLQCVLNITINCQLPSHCTPIQ